MSEKVDFDITKCNNESALRMDSGAYNAGTLGKQLIHEEVNSIQNYAAIVEAYNNKRARDISAEIKVNKEPAFILGSGPSLDDSIKYLKDWKGGIFCTTSHALTLMYHGIEPTHIVALDPFCTWEEIEGIDWSKTKTKLIAHPGVWPSLVQKWPNEILLYRERLSDPNSFYATTQKRMYTWREEVGKGIRDPIFHYYIPTEITLFACSPPVQLFLADFLGYESLFLAGVDFAYHSGLERCTNYTIKGKKPDGTIEWEKHVHPHTPKQSDVITDNKLFTESIHLYYKKNFISAWRLLNKAIYTTDKGAITEVPFVDIKKVIKKQGLKMPEFGSAYIAHATEMYLAKLSAFIVDTNKEISFVESEKPEFELPRYMHELDTQYYCPNCHVTMKANDFMEHEQEECLNCHKGLLIHSHKVNIQENIKKFKFLLRANKIETKDEEWDMFRIECEKRIEEIKAKAEKEKENDSSHV